MYIINVRAQLQLHSHKKKKLHYCQHDSSQIVSTPKLDWKLIAAKSHGGLNIKNIHPEKLAQKAHRSSYIILISIYFYLNK